MSNGKRPTDHLEPPAKKRGSERQLTKDDGSDDEVEEAGTFQRADEATLKQRKIIRARRTAGATAAANPFANVNLVPVAGAAPAATNPFAGISLFPPPAAPAAPPAVPPSAEAAAAPAPQPEGIAPGAASEAAEQQAPAEVKADVSTDMPVGSTAPEAPAVAPADAAVGREQAAPAQAVEAKKADAAEDQKVTQTNGFQPAEKPAIGGFGAFAAGLNGGLAFGGGGGFGSLASAGSAPAFASGTSTGGTGFGASNSAAAAAPSIFGSVTATGTSLFGQVPAGLKPELPAAQMVSTGEEEERHVFSGEGNLFEFDAGKQWRERGRGEVRVNVDKQTGQGRIVMRQKGNLRLLLNANLWPEMQVTRMEGGSGVTFACMNHLDSAEKQAHKGDTDAATTKLATYALRIKAADVLERFIAAVDAHKHATA